MIGGEGYPLPTPYLRILERENLKMVYPENRVYYLVNDLAKKIPEKISCGPCLKKIKKVYLLILVKTQT